MKKLIATLAVMSLLAALAIASGTATGSDTATTARSGTVKLTENNFFSSGTLRVRRHRRVTINRGNRITFVWQGDSPHNLKGIRGNRFGPTETTDEDGHRERKRFTRDSVVICQVHRSTMRLRVNVRQDR